MCKSNARKSSESNVKQVCLFALSVIRWIIDGIVDFIFGFIYRSETNAKLPPVKHPFLTKSAVDLAMLIRTKKLTSKEVVSAYIDRIKEVNPILNAVVCERFEEALKEAQAVDELLATTSQTEDEILKSKPFLGVPFTSKESSASKGMSFTFGIVARKGRIADEDSVIVSNVKKSGAILLGVTNVPEINLWCESRNNIYGQTQNPYDLTRTPGGSSGGEASIITACGSAFGIGTDIGGSTRMPAYFCGLFGHKHTNGLVCTKGMTFRTGTDDSTTMVTTGSITRHAEDIAPLIKILLGNESSKLKLDSKVDVKNLKIFYTLEPGDVKVSPLSKEVIKTILKVVDYLMGVTEKHVDKVHLEGFRYCHSLWRHEMSKESKSFAKDLANREGEVTLSKEIPKLLLGQCNHTLPCIMRLIDLNILPPTNSEWAEKTLKTLLDEITELLGDNGVLLFPSCPTDAPFHYASFFRPYNFSYWAIFNALKLPVTQVPLGLSSNGLPLGIQVVAGPYNDHLTIAVAKELEKGFSAWVPPFPSC